MTHDISGQRRWSEVLPSFTRGIDSNDTARVLASRPVTIDDVEVIGKRSICQERRIGKRRYDEGGDRASERSAREGENPAILDEHMDPPVDGEVAGIQQIGDVIGIGPDVCRRVTGSLIEADQVSVP